MDYGDSCPTPAPRLSAVSKVAAAPSEDLNDRSLAVAFARLVARLEHHLHFAK